MNLKRIATHADSWYEGNSIKLQKQIEKLLEEANVNIKGTPKALIAPHAGYKYSGKTASFAYKPFINSKL